MERNRVPRTRSGPLRKLPRASRPPPCVSVMLVNSRLAFDLGNSDVCVELRYLPSLYQNCTSYLAHQLPSALFLQPSLLTLPVTISEKVQVFRFGVIIILIE